METRHLLNKSPTQIQLFGPLTTYIYIEIPSVSCPITPLLPCLPPPCLSPHTHTCVSTHRRRRPLIRKQIFLIASIKADIRCRSQ